MEGIIPATTKKLHRLLVVEDHLELRELLTNLLSLCGYEVYSAADGAAALALLDRARPHAIISDYVMPDMDGVDLCSEIRSRSAYSGIPIILYSAYDADRKIQDLLARPGVTYIHKSTSPRGLVEELKRLITPASDGAPEGETV